MSTYLANNDLDHLDDQGGGIYIKKKPFFVDR